MPNRVAPLLALSSLILAGCPPPKPVVDPTSPVEQREESAEQLRKEVFQSVEDGGGELEPEILESIDRAVDDPIGSVRWNGLMALSKLDGPRLRESLPKIEQGLVDPDPLIAGASGAALFQAWKKKAVPRSQKKATSQKVKAATERLQPALASSDPETVRQALEVLVTLETSGRPVGPQVVKLLEHPDPEVGKRALDALSAMMWSKVPNHLLVRYMETSDMAHRHTAGYLFLFPDRVGELLTVLRTSEDATARAVAITLLGSTQLYWKYRGGKPVVMPDIRKALDDEDWRVRASAERAIERVESGGP